MILSGGGGGRKGCLWTNLQRGIRCKVLKLIVGREFVSRRTSARKSGATPCITENSVEAKSARSNNLPRRFILPWQAPVEFLLPLCSPPRLAPQNIEDYWCFTGRNVMFPLLKDMQERASGWCGTFYQYTENSCKTLPDCTKRFEFVGFVMAAKVNLRSQPLERSVLTWLFVHMKVGGDEVRACWDWDTLQDRQQVWIFFQGIDTGENCKWIPTGQYPVCEYRTIDPIAEANLFTRGYVFDWSWGCGYQ